MEYNKKTLRDWAYSCMPPEKAKSFLNYYKGCLYKIVDKKVSLLKEEDLVPQHEFEVYHSDFENFVTSYDYLWFKAAWISSTAFYFKSKYTK